VIALWMLYCVGIGLAFVVVGHALERALQFAGRPTRWAWVIAVAGSLFVPAAAWLRPDAFASFAVPIPVTVASPVNLSTSPSTSLAQPPARSFSLSDADATLRWGWGLASIAMLLTLAVAAIRLIALRRRWRPTAINGRMVLVSQETGPAVVGVLRPRVVVPQWALELPVEERELMLAHEEQHVRAGDPTLLATAFLAWLVAPWNPALWWQWRRLRLAVEMDCDARVLAHGRSAAAYGELLLQVGRRRTSQLLGAPAFGEPASFLESRIRRMFASVPRWRWAGAAAGLMVAAGAIVGACETPRPLAPPQDTVSSQEVMDQLATKESERLRPWVETNAGRMFPSILEPSGPPMDAFLIHDARLHVYRGTLTTLNYLGDAGARPNRGIDLVHLQRALPSFDPGHDGWGVIDARTLKGIVRDNVRVTWIHHDPQPQDTARQFSPRSQVSAALEAALRHADFLRGLATEYEPGLLAHPPANAAVGMIVDAKYRVIAHTSGTREAGDRTCVDVLKRLLPAFRNARFETVGCLDADSDPPAVNP